MLQHWNGRNLLLVKLECDIINGSFSFLEASLNMTSETLEILPNSPRSYGDISSETVNSELSLLFGGYIIMFIYTVVMLGKVNMVEMRVLLSAIGIISIGMGIFIAICIRY